MKTRPITPARIAFAGVAGEPPSAPDYGDVYHPRIGAPAQARHVFLQGNALPQRWAGRARFVILETGFGLANNFLATWEAWRGDAQRCASLHFVAVDRHPPTREDLARAHADSALPALAAALVDAWPPLTPNLHTLDFEDGRVQLTLAFGDVALVLPALRLQADAIFLDGFAPARNPEMWTPQVLKSLARLAAPGATASTWSVAAALQDGLTAAGFEVQRAPGIGGKREITVARWAPRFAARRLPTGAVASRTAVVVGAGVAGASAARALARQGLSVTVLERLPGFGPDPSGHLAGIFHGSVNADDGRYARLYRAAAIAAAAEYRAAVGAGGVRGEVRGLLRVAARGHGQAALQATLRRLGLPPEYVRAVDEGEASRLAGVPLDRACWHYPGGGWLAPADWVHWALGAPGVELRTGAEVHSLQRDGDDWRLLDAGGAELARTPVVVLANAGGAGPLLAPLGHAPWPLHTSRGQITYWSPPRSTGLRLPLAGEGYAIPMPQALLCGATRQRDDDDGELRRADHLLNLARLRSLTGIDAPADESLWHGCVGWRVHADDRLPIAGAVPLADLRTHARRDQARLLPRASGLFVLTALGSRGLTLAPLLARLVAAQAVGAPWPLEQDLVDAVDPARWIVRAARQPP